MGKEKIQELPEDIYILEAASLGLISISDGLMRVAAVNVEVRCAFTLAAGQIAYVSEKTPFLELYPDPKQVSVFRMLFTDGILREFRLLAHDLRQELVGQWERVYVRPADKAKQEIDRDKYGRVWMKCSNTAFEAIDMTLIPKPGESSEYWERMIAVADALKDND